MHACQLRQGGIDLVGTNAVSFSNDGFVSAIAPDASNSSVGTFDNKSGADDAQLISVDVK